MAENTIDASTVDLVLVATLKGEEIFRYVYEHPGGHTFGQLADTAIQAFQHQKPDVSIINPDLCFAFTFAD